MNMLIRKLVEEDSQAFLSMQQQLDRETKNMMYEPGERLNDVNITRSNIKASIEKDNLLLCAVLDMEIVGYLAATKGSFLRNRHSAYIVIGLLEKARSKGFEIEGMKHRSLFIDGEYVDEYYMGLLL